MRWSCVVILFTILAAPPLYGDYDDINIDANGWNWTAMSISEKKVFTVLLYKQLGTDEQKYPIESVIDKVNYYYLLAKNKPTDEQIKYLKIPIAVVMGWITGCKIKMLDDNKSSKDAED